MLINILLLLAVAALIVYVLYLRAQIYDLRWTREKIIPLMREVSRLDPEEREYLDPEILHAFGRGEITIDQAIVLSEQSAQHS